MSARKSRDSSAVSSKSGRRTKADPLAPLAVIDRLEIGPVRVERRRISAPYAVVRGAEREAIDLVYRFEEDVFDDDPGSQNLAAMMTAQVALNYGLFCREIVFRGSYDEADRRFLQKFTENTAREIYVNKFLMPNEFLTGPAQDLPAERQDRYSRAAIRIETEGGGAAATRWHTNPARHAVLSSGGKDSLLSFGLLNELGRETHSIFVNESGRHWYTALNAYRHFAAAVPHSTRVWTNSDRVFSWMLRRLPFVRQDFARIRSDEYPIRLWTVAVFLFGALPLLRKRGIGRLVIGDEFDTTVRVHHHGIPHYNALFDQSRFFDNEMSRYFGKKGWDLCQFSLLRPLSEMLIEQILVERYPDLQRHQLSCHAAHLHGGRARPCGKCEKCRRIVGMLLALEAHPGECGYSDAQIDDCAKALARKGVHQESPAAEQLAFMLREKGILSADAAGGPLPREHPEILSLRFDQVRSPVEAVPRDLREPLHRIYLQHARGALARNGRVWLEFDPLDPTALARPYAFEAVDPPEPTGIGAPRAPRGKPAYLLAEMTWPEAEARFKKMDVALLPVGAIEQHGPHLPLDTDTYDADYLCKRVAEGCSDPRPIVLPPIAYGVSYHHLGFGGTLSVSPETQSRLVYEIGMSTARSGVTKLVIINGHGGNAPALHLAAQMINRDAHIFTCVDTGETSDTDIEKLVQTPNDVHAGEIETSTTLAIRPGLVRMNRAAKSVPRFSSRYLDFSSKRGVGWYAYTNKISKNGIMGDATLATAEKGERIWELMTKHLVQLVEDLKRLSLDEIYQRRY